MSLVYAAAVLFVLPNEIENRNYHQKKAFVAKIRALKHKIMHFLQNLKTGKVFFVKLLANTFLNHL
jgi:hypothetical protein